MRPNPSFERTRSGRLLQAFISFPGLAQPASTRLSAQTVRQHEPMVLTNAKTSAELRMLPSQENSA